MQQATVGYDCRDSGGLAYQNIFRRTIGDLQASNTRGLRRSLRVARSAKHEVAVSKANFATFALCKLAHRAPEYSGLRKVRTTQSTVLPNGKGPPLADTASAAENNRPKQLG